MDTATFFLLARDGLTTGAIYALLGVATVVVFAVTRVVYLAQGEFVAFAALTLVAFEDGRVPGITGLLLVMGVIATVSRLVQGRDDLRVGKVLRILAVDLGIPIAFWLAVRWIAPSKPGPWVTVPLTVAMVTVLATAIYRIVFQPLATASVLVLLIAAFGVHMVLLGLGLYFFGPEGFQTQPFTEAAFEVGGMRIKWQDLIVLATVVVLMIALAWFFAKARAGKALRAAAINRVGASLVGIATETTGLIAFAMAGAIGAISGVLIGPVTIVYYDTGFMIGLRGFVAAVLGGLVSYPLTVAAALGLGFFESAASFWASSYKEVLVFLLIVPVLLWRSIAEPHAADDDA